MVTYRKTGLFGHPGATWSPARWFIAFTYSVFQLWCVVVSFMRIPSRCQVRILRMVRHYARTPGARRYHEFTDEEVAQAIAAVQAGMSKNQAAATFKIPRTTLVRRIARKNRKPVGHPRVLSNDEEATIADTLGVVAAWGFPLTRMDVREVIAKYLKKQGKQIRVFKNNIPGEDFLNGFILRNNLSVRLASNIKRSRSSVGRNDVLAFFNHIKPAINDSNEVEIYNYDETNLVDDPGAKKVVVPRSTKRVERVQNHSRTVISLMICGNAKGVLLPPMVVYKAGNMYDNWRIGGPPGTIYANSTSGWFDMNLFEMWFDKILLPHIKQSRAPGTKTIVVGDNLASHFSPAVIRSCQQNDIYFTPIPANATHLMQPLDVAVFGPMKKCWRQVLGNWRRESRYPGNLPKEQFPQLLSRLWTQMSENVSKNLISGFRATGLYPLNPHEVLKRIPDGLVPEDDQGTIGRSLDASLIDLLREHRGVDTEDKPKKKRGRKIEPGRNMTDDLDNGKESENLESKSDSTSAPREPKSHAAPQCSGTRKYGKKKTTKIQVKIAPRVRSSRQTKPQANAECGVCKCNRKHYVVNREWLRCVQCLQWICGTCNAGSKDPYYTCDNCDDSDDQRFDDTDEDKDFVPGP